MPHLRELPSPLAINMWDFTWLTRHYATDPLGDWDRALDELVDRGYNALRIDCFPQLVAAGPDGQRPETSTFSPKKLGFAVWGNAWTTTVNPRQDLLDFLGKCRDREVFVGLSTWFWEDADKRNTRIQGLAEFVRVWDETLRFLADHNALNNVVYVDLLNEYPYWHGFTWLTKMLETMSEPVVPGGGFNLRQRDFHRQFIYDALDQLRGRWPTLDFLASQTHNWQEHADMDYRHFSLIDSHIWFVHHPDFGGATGYNAEIHPMERDAKWAEVHAAMKAMWTGRRTEFIDWMDGRLAEMAAVAGKFNLPLGNTEGWGAINWCDHPAFDWDLIKDAGEICAHLGAKHGFAFNCTSNFNHPYFGLWQDIAWHRKVTGIIKQPAAYGGV